MNRVSRTGLLRGLRVFFILILVGIAYVLIDYSFNRPALKSYQFTLPNLPVDTPILLRQQNLLILVARYESKTVSAIQSEYIEANPESSNPSGLPLLNNNYFVAMGYGTLSSCPIEVEARYFKESCSDARYDRLGRSLDKQRFPDLKVPQYTFNDSFSILTIE